uniref:Zinc transporter ZIP6 n=1 Tax=Sinocyclocheilus grahami TaxID=75366 RepID=A0A672MZG9_SINGR
MFLIEHFLTLGKMYKDKKQKVSKIDMDCENKCHSHFHDTVGHSDEQHHHHHDYHHILHHHHSQNHHPHTHTHRHTHSYSLQHFQQADVATLAWMVIMGDGLHNFSDVLAIGAAFTEALSSGLSTSVAVFCHELGDFAVLLKAGMSVRQAILYNVLSALMGYLGMITGILMLPHGSLLLRLGYSCTSLLWTW